ncbi:hypothetical protein ABW19_dt0210405 [Dactylella cylindrospora]|nr:hypothetical protein ABW19_dt0210405 [Dactylella cylindrospora]
MKIHIFLTICLSLRFHLALLTPGVLENTLLPSKEVTHSKSLARRSRTFRSLRLSKLTPTNGDPDPDIIYVDSPKLEFKSGSRRPGRTRENPDSPSLGYGADDESEDSQSPNLYPSDDANLRKAYGAKVYGDYIRYYGSGPGFVLRASERAKISQENLRKLLSDSVRLDQSIVINRGDEAVESLRKVLAGSDGLSLAQGKTESQAQTSKADAIAYLEDRYYQYGTSSNAKLAKMFYEPEIKYIFSLLHNRRSPGTDYIVSSIGKAPQTSKITHPYWSLASRNDGHIAIQDPVILRDKLDYSLKITLAEAFHYLWLRSVDYDPPKYQSLSSIQLNCVTNRETLYVAERIWVELKMFSVANYHGISILRLTGDDPDPRKRVYFNYISGTEEVLAVIQWLHNYKEHLGRKDIYSISIAFSNGQKTMRSINIFVQLRNVEQRIES